MNRPVPIEEAQQYEFKEVMGQNPVGAIKNRVDEYAVAFLNGNGGGIFWGIRNHDRVVVGVSLNYNQRDELRRVVIEKLAQIKPPMLTSQYRIEFHETFKEENTLERVPEAYVVEVDIPKGDPTSLILRAVTKPL